MADDKGAKPSSNPFEGYDPIVLIVGALLALALISNLFNRGQYKPTAQKQPTQQKIEDTPRYEQSCGLFVVSPKPLEKVSGSLFLEGTVGSCEWIPVANVALYAQVIDATGMLVSDYTKVRAEGGPGTPNAPILGAARPFRAQIPLTAAPKSKTGFLILVHPDTERETSKTVRIPIRFQ